MWVKSLDGNQLNKCIRVYVRKGKKECELVGVIDCSTYGEMQVTLGAYATEELAKEALDKIENAISKGENIISLCD